MLAKRLNRWWARDQGCRSVLPHLAMVEVHRALRGRQTLQICFEGALLARTKTSFRRAITQLAALARSLVITLLSFITKSLCAHGMPTARCTIMGYQLDSGPV
jgi:hypothetical protein